MFLAFDGDSLNPVFPKSGLAFEDRSASDGSLPFFDEIDGNCFYSCGENVVITQGNEVLSIAMIPIDDHLREVVSVAPQRMGVSVSAIPV